MITIVTTKDSKTFNSKESLKSAGFAYSASDKRWYKDFDSAEDFESWETTKFRSATYAGRRQARLNEDTHFEVVEPVLEQVAVKVEQTTTEPATVINSIEEAISLIENGEANIETSIQGRPCKLVGYLFTDIDGCKVTDMREVKKSEPEQYSAMVNLLANLLIDVKSKYVY